MVAKKIAVVPTKFIFVSFCASTYIWYGGPPAWQSVEVKPDSAPDSTPPVTPGWPASRATRLGPIQ